MRLLGGAPLLLLVTTGALAQTSGAPEAGTAPRDTAADLRLSVAWAPEEPTVGDHVSATLVLSGVPAGASDPRFPVWQATWGDAEVVDVHAPARVDDGWRQQIVLAFFAPGERTLPVLSVQVPGPGGTRTVALDDPVTVTVRSVLEEDDVEPRPPAPPRAMPLGTRFLWLAGGLALACVAALLAISRRRAGGAEATEARRTPPLEELLASLAELDPVDRPTRAWEGATLALRRYLSRSLGFQAVESTTLQIQRFLSRRLTADLSSRILRLLRAADRIKFARGAASAASAEEAITGIGEVAREVERHLNPPTAGGEEAA